MIVSTLDGVPKVASVLSVEVSTRVIVAATVALELPLEVPLDVPLEIADPEVKLVAMFPSASRTWIVMGPSWPVTGGKLFGGKTEMIFNLVGALGLTTNGLDPLKKSPSLTMTEKVPVLGMKRLEKVATPLTVEVATMPLRWEDLGGLSSLSRMVEGVVMVLPAASSTVTLMVKLEASLALVGIWVKTRPLTSKALEVLEIFPLEAVSV